MRCSDDFGWGRNIGSGILSCTPVPPFVSPNKCPQAGELELKNDIHPPSSHLLSETSKMISQLRIQREQWQVESRAREQLMPEAVAAVECVRAAFTLLENNEGRAAEPLLQAALEKIDIVRKKKQGLRLIPVHSDVQVIDFAENEKDVRADGRYIRSMVDNREYQPARRALSRFASEINIRTTHLSLQHFPDAVHTALLRLHEHRLEAARVELSIALQGLVIIENAIPLPLIRAQALLEAVKHADEQALDDQEVQQLLDDATHQLLLAEEFGYGTRRQDFHDLTKTMTQIRKNRPRSQRLLEKAELDIQALKERVF